MPATDWEETIAADEAERFERYATYLGGVQSKRAHGGSLDRALHSKANLGVEAEFEIIADAPEDARVGMFATPKVYRAVARFSNGAARRQSDRKLDVRGLAVKVFGVDGKKVIEGLEDETTQDFLAIRSSVVPMRNAHQFMAIVRASSTPALLPLRLMGSLGPIGGIKLIRRALAGLKAPQSALAATSFYSALPIKYGPYAVQFTFTARDPAAPIKVGTATHLGDELAARLRERAVIYDFQVRFYRDPVTTPIEDATVEWDSPWVTVAKLTLPVQDPTSPRGIKVGELVEQLGFDPWHAREDLRPLGDIMRARSAAYRVSTQARKSMPEPRTAPVFD
ncbi:MAG: hypothetical protein H0V17_03470 [Deltaproteobacteria bacterium]|nr:hypothetical protein [Deltaproteobacteria bacterium]